MKLKPTPRPWGFGEIEDNTVCEKGGGGFVIHRPNSKTEFDYVDLTYIIHCVNSHEDMLEALEEIRRVFKGDIHVIVRANTTDAEQALYDAYEKVTKPSPKLKESDMIKITKNDLLDVTTCVKRHDIIRKHWPERRRKISLVELIEIARDVEVTEFYIQWVLFHFDLPRWDEAQRKESNADEAGSKKIVDNYLNEQVERD